MVAGKTRPVVERSALRRSVARAPYRAPQSYVPEFPFENLEGSQRINMTIGKGMTAERTIKCAGESLDFVLDLMTPYPGNWFATFPGIPTLWVDTMEVTPFQGAAIIGSVGDSFLYKELQIKITYKTQEFDTQDYATGPDPTRDTTERQGGDPRGNAETLLSFRRSIGGEFMLLPATGLEWDALYNKLTDTHYSDADEDAALGSRKVSGDVQAGMIIPTSEINVTWHRCQRPPWTAIRDMVGYVNKLKFLGCNPGTLLFLGCDGNVDFTDRGGTKWWTVEYKFSYKNNKKKKDGTGLLGNLLDKGWNYFYRVESGRFEKLLTRGKYIQVGGPNDPGNPTGPTIEKRTDPGKAIYDEEDFRPLFIQGV